MSIGSLVIEGHDLIHHEYKYPFRYGEFGDQAILLVKKPYGSWGGHLYPAITMIALPGAWRRIGKVPDTLISKQMLKAAGDVSGLKLVYRVAPWKQERDVWVRPVVLVGDNSRRVHELFPALAAV